jgi:hypothetical protein
MGKRFICSTKISDFDAPKERGHTHDFNGIGWTSNTVGIIFDNVGGFINPLDRTSFDVKLIVAEAVSPKYSY